jgi:hypothetical protein
MRRGRVVDHQIDNNPDAERLSVIHERHELAVRTVWAVDSVEVGDVVAVILARRGIEGLQPDAGDAEAGQVVEPPAHPFEVADGVAVGVEVFRDRHAADDRVLVAEIFNRHRVMLRRRP